MRRLHRAKGLHRLRQYQLVERITVEIPGQPTSTAHEVVVSTEVRIESGAIAGWVKRRDQTEVGEQPKSPVDGVQRHRRDPLANAPVDGLCVRVVAILPDLAEDFDPLVGELDTCTPTDLFEVRHLPLDFGLTGLHRPSAK